MTLQLSEIPDAVSEEPVRERTKALTELGSLAKRRTVLRAMALAGATIGATALGWSPLGRAGQARAETSPTGLTGWDALDCKDAYPNGYAEERDNVGVYTAEPGACFGGYYIGSTMCDSTGWHKAVSERISWSQTRSYRPISTACGATTTKNAWRWTVNGVT
ncbi:MAG: hypothetical protein IPK37_13905 [Austwickia sp.]|jgi:hypothetical protein|nr:MAG: hypothetical protein IPK37_13905 [Austwickia sp.]